MHTDFALLFSHLRRRPHPDTYHVIITEADSYDFMDMISLQGRTNLFESVYWSIQKLASITQALRITLLNHQHQLLSFSFLLLTTTYLSVLGHYCSPGPSSWKNSRCHQANRGWYQGEAIPSYHCRWNQTLLTYLSVLGCYCSPGPSSWKKRSLSSSK